MALLHDSVLDAALAVIVSNGSKLNLCSSEPATYAGISSVSLGSKTGITVGSPADRTGGGRKITISAITDGTSSANGTASHFAISNGTNAIYATGSLATTQGVLSGGIFTLTAFDIEIPDPA